MLNLVLTPMFTLDECGSGGSGVGVVMKEVAGTFSA